MPDEAAAPVEETPQSTAPEAPEGTPSAETPPSTDWESTENPYRKRYEDIRPQWDRTNAENAEYRQLIEALHSDDGDLRKQAADALGFEFEDDDPGMEPDELEMLKGELAKLKEGFNSRQEQEQAQQVRQQEIDHMDTELTQLEKSEGVDFSEAEVKLIASVASQVRDDQGAPDVKAAYQLLIDADKVRSERQVKAKKAPQVRPGSPGEREFEFKDPKARRARMAELVAAGSDE